MARDDDFVTTIEDEDEIVYEEDEDGLEDEKNDEVMGQRGRELKRKRGEGNESRKPDGNKKTKKGKKSADEKEDKVYSAFHVEDDGAMDPDFEFEFDAGYFESGVTEDFDGWGMDLEPGPNGKKGVDVDELIERRKARSKPADATSENEEKLDLENDELLAPDGFGMGVTEEESEAADQDEDDATSDSDASAASPMPHPDDSPPTEDEESDAEERTRREAFFAPEPTGPSKPHDQRSSFQTFFLSRPILRGLNALNFSTPTPIQAKTIPVALMGKDVVGGAITGSGKTAAFMVPILERLLFRSRKRTCTRVVVLVPTRELAVQCFNVAQKIGAFTDITFAQIVGGFSLREQESVLRRRPDVVVATPGRFIDHMRNTAAFAVDGIEILVLDEADRMLEEGFADELNEILSTLPRSRQTMLFSATMTSKVDDLVRVGLQQPVRLMVDASRQTAGSLIQEFVRLRAGREDSRLAYLMYLVSEVYTSRVIVFFRQKKELHRVRVIFALCGLKAAELHGGISQDQRISAVEAFRAGSATHLLATDVASRGLDIRGVEAVLNYEAPQSQEIYLHRVGRTARMGKAGRACTLAAEQDRKVVKAAVKTARKQGAKIVSKLIPPEAADAWVKRLKDLEGELEEVLKEEKEEKALSQADMHVKKAENVMEYEAEIKARPKRTWFATEKEKKKAQDAGRVALNGQGKAALNGEGGLSQSERRDKRRAQEGKLSNKARKRAEDRQLRKEERPFKKGKADRTGARAKGAAAKPVKTRETKRYNMKLKAGKKK